MLKSFLYSVNLTAQTHKSPHLINISLPQHPLLIPRSREARAKVIAAEGEHKASRALKEAAEVIVDSPAALQLRSAFTLYVISVISHHIHSPSEPKISRLEQQSLGICRP